MIGTPELGKYQGVSILNYGDAETVWEGLGHQNC